MWGGVKRERQGQHVGAAGQPALGYGNLVNPSPAATGQLLEVGSYTIYHVYVAALAPTTHNIPASPRPAAAARSYLPADRCWSEARTPDGTLLPTPDLHAVERGKAKVMTL